MRLKRPRRRPWTARQWSEFLRRARRLDRRIDELVRDLPDARGLDLAVIGPIFDAMHRWGAACADAEALAVAQHPGLASRFPATPDRPRPLPIRSAKGAPRLPSGKWRRLLARVESIRGAIVPVILDIHTAAGAVPLSGSFSHASRAFSTGSSRLHDVRRRQYPASKTC